MKGAYLRKPDSARVFLCRLAVLPFNRCRPMSSSAAKVVSSKDEMLSRTEALFSVLNQVPDEECTSRTGVVRCHPMNPDKQRSSRAHKARRLIRL